MKGGIMVSERIFTRLAKKYGLGRKVAYELAKETLVPLVEGKSEDEMVVLPFDFLLELEILVSGRKLKKRQKFFFQIDEAQLRSVFETKEAASTGIVLTI